MSVTARRMMGDLRSWRRIVSFGGFLGVRFLLMATPAVAQEGEPSAADSKAGWIFRWVNFAIVFGAIGYFAVKKFREPVAVAPQWTKTKAS